MDTAMKAIREKFVNLRREKPYAIVHNGSSKTVFGCICGSTHSCSTEWRGRDSKHVIDWKADHEKCADKLLNKLSLCGGNLVAYKDIFNTGHIWIRVE